MIWEAAGNFELVLGRTGEPSWQTRLLGGVDDLIETASSGDDFQKAMSIPDLYVELQPTNSTVSIDIPTRGLRHSTDLCGCEIVFSSTYSPGEIQRRKKVGFFQGWGAARQV